MSSKIKIAKAVGTVALCLVMFVSLTALTVLATVNATLADPEALGTRLIDGELEMAVCTSVRSALEREMMRTEIRYSDIADVVTDDAVKERLPEAVSALTSGLFGEKSEWRYEDEALLERVRSYNKDYAVKYGIEYSESDTEAVYSMITDTITSEMQVRAQVYAVKAAPIMAKVKRLCGLWFIPLLVYAAAAAGVIVIDRRRMRNALHNAMMPTYFGFFTVFVVSALMYSRDYLAKTVLGNRAFQYFLRQLWNTVLGDMRTVSLVLTLIAVAAIISMAWIGRLRWSDTVKDVHCRT